MQTHFAISRGPLRRGRNINKLLFKHSRWSKNKADAQHYSIVLR